MSTITARPAGEQAESVTPARSAKRSAARAGSRRVSRPAYGAGIGAAIWLVLVVVPLYFLIATSLRGSGDYLSAGPLSIPEEITLDAYRRAFEVGFLKFLTNSLIVAFGAIILVLAVALPAAFAIVRSKSRVVRIGFTLFLLGLAVPAQAVIIPIYLLITRLHLYDCSPRSSCRPPRSRCPCPSSSSPARCGISPVRCTRPCPWTVQATSRSSGTWCSPVPPRGGHRDDLRGSQRLERLPVPPGADPEHGHRRVLPLGLWEFQTQYGTDVPGLMAAVVLSALPVLALYLFGRRQLLSGLAAGIGK